MSDDIKSILIGLKECVGLVEEDILFDINEYELFIYTNNFEELSQDLAKEYLKKNKKLLLSCGIKRVNVHNCYRI